MAGGRISGLFARATGTTVKGLVPVAGEPLVRRVVGSLQATPAIRRVCVVGPEEVRETLPEGVLWCRGTGRVVQNLRSGIEELGISNRRLLLCGTDVPALTPEALSDFIARTPEEAEISMPVVRKERFTATFPGNLGIYVRLVEGSFTGGGQYLVDPRKLLEVLPLLQRLFDSRKSQLAMAAVMGRAVVWKLIRHRLTVTELETRLSELTHCRCRAVMDCAPELAFDLDAWMDLRYFEGWLQRP